MFTEQIKAIIRRYIEDILNQGNLAAIDQLLIPNFVIRHDDIPSRCAVWNTSNNLSVYFAPPFRIFAPHLRMRLLKAIRQQSVCLARDTPGYIPEDPPTVRPLTAPGIAVYHVAGCKIAKRGS